MYRERDIDIDTDRDRDIDVDIDKAHPLPPGRGEKTSGHFLFG